MYVYMMSEYTYLSVMRVCVCPLSHTRNLWGVFKGHNQIKVSSGIYKRKYLYGLCSAHLASCI